MKFCQGVAYLICLFFFFCSPFLCCCKQYFPEIALRFPRCEVRNTAVFKSTVFKSAQWWLGGKVKSLSQEAIGNMQPSIIKCEKECVFGHTWMFLKVFVRMYGRRVSTLLRISGQRLFYSVTGENGKGRKIQTWPANVKQGCNGKLPGQSQLLMRGCV